MGLIFNIQNLLQLTVHRFKARLRYLTNTALWTGAMLTAFFVAIIGIATFFLRDEVLYIYEWITVAILSGRAGDGLPLAPWDAVRGVLGKSLIAVVAIAAGSCWVNAILWRAVIADRPHTPGRIVREVNQVFPRLFGAVTVKYLLIYVGLVFFIVPGIICAGLLVFTEICAAKGDGPLQALRTSAGLVWNRWWHIAVPATINFVTTTFVLIVAAVVPIFLSRADALLHATLTAIFLGVVSVLIFPWHHQFKKHLFDDARKHVMAEAFILGSPTPALL